MKKTLFITTVVLIVFPLLANASWWNPVDWFSFLFQDIFHMQQATTTSTSPIQLNSAISNNTPTSTTKILVNNDSNETTQNKSALTQPKPLEPMNQVVQPAVVVNTPAINTLNQPQTANTQTIQQTTINPVVPISTTGPTFISLFRNVPTVVSTSYNQYPGLPLLIFTLSPSSDRQILNSLNVNISSTGQGSVNTAYLYKDNSIISTAIVLNGKVVFSNIQNLSDLTPHEDNIFKIEVDVSGLKNNGDNESIFASIDNAEILDSKGQNVKVNGTVNGKVITVTNIY